MNTMVEGLPADDRSWEKIIMKYNHPDLRKSIWQISNSFIPYVLMWFVMYQSLRYPYWVTLLLSLLACGFLIRLFIIFHDCGHGSFFKSAKANYFVGAICGILAFTPYKKWHYQHRVHHATSGNLDKRGIGDVWTLTVDEYMHLSKWKRIVYKSFRNPYVMFTVGPIVVVFLQNRLTHKGMTREERMNIYATNIILLVMAVGISLLIGVKAYLLIQMPIILISHSIGLWLFYVQHQFEEVSWERGTEWDYKNAAIQGSSFLKMPVVFQWFTGNIGYHHVHHLSPKIPNYYLARCHAENELFKGVKPVVLFSTFKTLRLGLWDEARRQMVTFRIAKAGLRGVSAR
jgi:omega-6 fatty acid desaturase (delta-12 desaturase)